MQPHNGGLPLDNSGSSSLTCPVLGCDHQEASARNLRQHLLLRHNKNEIFHAHALGFLAPRGIYMCTRCNDASPVLYLQKHRYDAHVLSKHERPRVDSNSSLCRRLFHTGDSFPDKWDACFDYFNNLPWGSTLPTLSCGITRMPCLSYVVKRSFNRVGLLL